MLPCGLMQLGGLKYCFFCFVCTIEIDTGHGYSAHSLVNYKNPYAHFQRRNLYLRAVSQSCKFPTHTKCTLLHIWVDSKHAKFLVLIPHYQLAAAITAQLRSAARRLTHTQGFEIFREK
jgi:hypothetical protein